MPSIKPLFVLLEVTYALIRRYVLSEGMPHLKYGKNFWLGPRKKYTLPRRVLRRNVSELFLLFQIWRYNDMESIKWSRIFFQKPKLPIAICLAIFLFCLYYISIIKSASNGHEITEYETENTPEYKSAQLGSSNNEHIKELLEELRFYNELDSSRQKNGSYASENIRKDPRDGGTYRLPQVLVIGSKKCGTGEW